MPNAGTTAVLDRRVKVIEGSPEQKESVQRASDLRPVPFVVLLGEPGIGKSTVLDIEAAHEQVSVLKVRALMTGTRPAANGTLFLDALDEYRTDGQPSEKAYGIANAITDTKASRWRLSCRSEDWRKAADITPIQQTTAGQPILVAQLLPLDPDEAASVLTALGEDNPKQFLAKAKGLGASGFIQSPLSLKLLHKAVANGGVWPSTRYDLFAAAIDRLAFERNDVHQWEDRSSPHDIISAAAKACILLLVSGRRALWRSNDEPPASVGDNRAYLTAHDLPFDRKLLEDVLDTPLFRGEGAAFEPMHRTIAEYLAGQALAKAVVSIDGRAALPLSRAIALVAGADGGPPTEIRGLYAWFAAHLAKLGDEAGALRLIEADAVTVLAYGDAAVFNTTGRRAILANLDRNDPYFRSSLEGDTAIGGLAGEDLADDFQTVLNGRADGTHRLMTVIDVLGSGVPVDSVRPTLRRIALDPQRPEWIRWRAADAWLNGAGDRTPAVRELFDAVFSEPISVGREALRTHLAAALPTPEISVSDIKSILADYQRCPVDNTLGRLFGLHRKLEIEPRPELFDEPVNGWLPDDNERRRKYEITHLLDDLLASAIRSTGDLTAARLWRWTVNLQHDRWDNLPDKAAKASVEWLDADPQRPVDFFDAILAEDDPENGPWMVVNTYFTKTRRRPNSSIVQHTLALATAAVTKAAAKRLLEIAAAMVDSPEADTRAYWAVYDRVANQSGCKALLKKMSSAKIEPWRRQQQRRTRQRHLQDEKQKASNIRILAPMLAELRAGGRAQNLNWAATLYFHPEDRHDLQDGIGRITNFSDEATTEAILAGWHYLATQDLPGVSAGQLGATEAEQRRYYVEWPAIAGLDRLFDQGAPPNFANAPITLAIVVLKSSWVVQNEDRRKRLEGWAIDRLDQDAVTGTAQLLAFWNAILDAGSSRLSGIWQFTEGQKRSIAFSRAIDTLLDTRRTMPPEVLRTTLQAAAKCLEPSRILALALSALADPAVVGAQQHIWSFVAFALDPVSHGARLINEHTAGHRGALFDDDIDGLIKAFGSIDEGARAHREAVMVRLLGPTCSPNEEQRSGRVTRAAHLTDKVFGAINWLAANPGSDARSMLTELVANPELIAWRPSLRHAQAKQSSLHRDRAFEHPAPQVVRAALSGGPPVNASDLQAVVMEQLDRLRTELHTGNNTPWKRYWNVDSHGKVTTPLIENQCRDHLLDRLHDRLQPYHIAAALPEARRGEETRADALILSGAGANLPVEAKRHYHADVWTASSTQLQGYAADVRAEGFGIYLVFWFGVVVAQTPPRADGNERPTSASAMEAILVADLPSNIKARTKVIVFDVSNRET